MVADNQELVAADPAAAATAAAPGGARPAPTSLRAPAAGLVPRCGPPSARRPRRRPGPMFRISINNEI